METSLNLVLEDILIFTTGVRAEPPLGCTPS